MLVGDAECPQRTHGNKTGIAGGEDHVDCGLVGRNEPTVELLWSSSGFELRHLPPVDPLCLVL